MPGFELIGTEEANEVSEVFEKSGILFRHSFDQLRNGIYKTKSFEESFSKRMQVNHSLAVSSGTAALKVALEAIGIGVGDEVITQSFTFVATVESIIESRANPVIAEIDKTLNMDPSDLAKKITNKTKAIIVVHMLGIPCRLEEILEIANSRNIPVIEDTAWGCGATLKDKPLGTWGAIGCFSFDFAKTITTGEGGMVATNRTDIYDRAAAYHDHGHENNPELPRWEDSRSSSGFNFRMNELQGAVGLAQLKKLDYIIQRQRNCFNAIWKELSTLTNIELREQPTGSNGTADALIFFVDTPKTARNCRDKLIDEGFSTKILPEAVTWHFAANWNHMKELVDCNPIPLSEAFPKSSKLLARAVSIPISVNWDPVMPRKVKSAIEKAIL